MAHISCVNSCSPACADPFEDPEAQLCQAPEPFFVPDPEEPIAPATFAELPTGSPLVLNTTLDHYCARKGRAEGEADLRRIAAGPLQIEEGFVYVEGQDKNGEPLSVWYETGIDSVCDGYPCANMNYKRVTLARIQADFAVVSALSLYHTHPDVGLWQGQFRRYASTSDLELALIYAVASDVNPMQPFIDRFDMRIVSDESVLTLTPNAAVITENVWAIPLMLDRYEFALRYVGPVTQGLASIFMTREERMAEIAQMMGGPHLKAEFTFFPDNE